MDISLWLLSFDLNLSKFSTILPEDFFNSCEAEPSEVDVGDEANKSDKSFDKFWTKGKAILNEIKNIKKQNEKINN